MTFPFLILDTFVESQLESFDQFSVQWKSHHMQLLCICSHDPFYHFSVSIVFFIYRYSVHMNNLVFNAPAYIFSQI